MSVTCFEINVPFKNSLQGKVEELEGLSEPTFYTGIREYPPTGNVPDFTDFSGPNFFISEADGQWFIGNDNTRNFSHFSI